MKARRAESLILSLLMLNTAAVVACAIVLLALIHHYDIFTAVIYGILIVTPCLYLFIVELEEHKQGLKQSGKPEG